MNSFQNTGNTDQVNVQDASGILNAQRHAFLTQDVPNLKARKANLAKLKAAVLKYRSQLQQAISEDFGNRSHHETDVMELVGVIQSIDYLTRHLRRFYAT